MSAEAYSWQAMMAAALLEAMLSLSRRWLYVLLSILRDGTIYTPTSVGVQAIAD